VIAKRAGKKILFPRAIALAEYVLQ